MFDTMTEADWRAVSRWDISKPIQPDLVSGLPAENARRITEYNRKVVEYKMCRSERLLYGILI
jgi:hypothetical protein